MCEGVVCTVIHESRELASPINLLRPTEYREAAVCTLCQSEWNGYGSVTNSPTFGTTQVYFYLMPQVVCGLVGYAAVYHFYFRESGWSVFYHLGYYWLLWHGERKMVNCSLTLKDLYLQVVHFWFHSLATVNHMPHLILWEQGRIILWLIGGRKPGNIRMQLLW